MVQLVHTTLHKALKQAVADDLIPCNMTEAVKTPRPVVTEMPPLSADQARALLEAARTEKLEALYILALTTGMRQGELLGLKWEDIDLQTGTLHIRRTLSTAMGAGFTFNPPKTAKSRRSIKVPKLALQTYPQIADKAEREGFEPSRRLNTAYAISNRAPSADSDTSPEATDGSLPKSETAAMAGSLARVPS
jgi:integrase